MILTKDKDFIIYLIKNKYIYKTHNIKYNFLVLILNIINKLVNYFNFNIILFEDNIKNVLFIKRLNFL